MIPRPDELAARSEMEREKNLQNNIKGTLKTAAGIGTAAMGAPILSGMAARLAPFLSKYVPTDLAIKGISKINPKLGDMLQKGQSLGLDVNEGMNFIKSKVDSSNSEPPKENRNILEQYSPELFSFIKEEVQKGRSALQAGAIAQNDKRFMSVIKKITQDHKTPWSAILQSVFGQEEGKAPKMAGNTILDAVRGQAQPQQPEAQQGQGNAKLMALLQQINQRLG